MRAPSRTNAIALLALVVALACCSTIAFVMPTPSFRRPVTLCKQQDILRGDSPGFPSQLSMAENDDTVDESFSSSIEEVRKVPASPPAAAKEQVGTSYPIDLPSPLLLSSSMILAIGSTGSVFELAGGEPKLGFAPTAAIAALGIPLCFFLFYAAIRKGIAETEEDDKDFLKKGGY